MKQDLAPLTDLPTLRPGVHQHGVALVFALVVLLILTILGLSGLRTSSLQQLMAGNTQELTRAFEAADSGLASAMNSIASGNPPDPSAYTTQSYTYAAMNAGAQVQAPTMLQIGPPARNTKPSGYGTASEVYYDQKSTGTTTTTFAFSNLHQGLSSGAPSNPYSP